MVIQIFFAANAQFIIDFLNLNITIFLISFLTIYLGKFNNNSMTLTYYFSSV